MAKIKNNYFELMQQQVAYCVEAATLLTEIMSNYNTLDIEQERAKMHDIENTGDEPFLLLCHVSFSEKIIRYSYIPRFHSVYTLFYS